MKNPLRLKIISAAIAAIVLSGCATLKGEVAPGDGHFADVARAKAYYQNHKGRSVIVTLDAAQRKELSAWLAAHGTGWKPYGDAQHPIPKSDIIVWHDDGSAFTINMFSTQGWKTTLLIERDPPEPDIIQSFSARDIEDLRGILK